MATSTSRQPTIQTDRLLLRPFRLSDGPDVQRLAGDYAIADTTLNMPHPYEDGVAEDWIATHPEHFASGDSATFAITLRETDDLVGAISLMIDQRHHRAELGYWVGVPHWNRGYTTEAARAILAYGFGTLGLNRIHAIHFTRNPASGRVMQNIGMLYEGRLCQHVLKWGKYEDIEAYGIVREDWRG